MLRFAATCGLTPTWPAHDLAIPGVKNSFASTSRFARGVFLNPRTGSRSPGGVLGAADRYPFQWRRSSSVVGARTRKSITPTHLV